MLHRFNKKHRNEPKHRFKYFATIAWNDLESPYEQLHIQRYDKDLLPYIGYTTVSGNGRNGFYTETFETLKRLSDNYNIKTLRDKDLHIINLTRFQIKRLNKYIEQKEQNNEKYN